MDGENAIATELRLELEALLTDEVVRNLVAAATTSRLSRLLAGLVL